MYDVNAIFGNVSNNRKRIFVHLLIKDFCRKLKAIVLCKGKEKEANSSQSPDSRILFKKKISVNLLICKSLTNESLSK